MTNSFNHATITCLVGGTGGRALMAGLKPHAVWPTAICTVCDSGGSTGRIRDAYPGTLALGDIRNCAEALMDEFYHGMLDIRLPQGHGEGENGLADHPVLNLIYLGAIEQARRQGKDQITAIAEVNQKLRLRGEVWPASPTPAHLEGTFCDGSTELGEHLLDRRPLTDHRVLTQVQLDREVYISRPAREAILKAKLIVLGPGDLYTSLIPILLVKGVKEAIAESQAPIVYVMNLMTKYAETRAFEPRNFLEKIFEYGIGRNHFDVVLINSGEIPHEVRERYVNKEHAEPVLWNPQVPGMGNDLYGFATHISPSNLLDQVALKEGFVRHDRVALANQLMEWVRT